MITPLLAPLALLLACTGKDADTGETGATEPITCADVDRSSCMQIEDGDS